MEFLAARQHGPADNYPITRIVMHGTVSPCVPGGAAAVARMFHTSSRDASTQYVVDPTTVVQCVPENVIAYGAPPNKGAIHVEQCDPQGGSPSRWQDAPHQAMLRLAARLVAGLCKKYDLPIRKLDPADLLAGRKGICGHADVSQAWHQTDHVDPGPDYPWEQFLSLVRYYATPATTPPSTTAKDELMFIVSLKSSPAQYVSNGLTRRWIPGPSYKADLITAGLNPHVFEFETVNGLEAMAGPLVPGTPDYTPPAA